MTCLLPDSLDEALALLASTPDAVPVAGGTSLLPHWPHGVDPGGRPLLDLSGIASLRRWGVDSHRLMLGALTTFWDVIQDRDLETEFPLLGLAATHVGSPLVQVRGTWGGNVAGASGAADGMLALVAYDAEIELRSVRGARRVPLVNFQLGGRRTDRQADELITAIHLPRRPRDQHWFHKVGRRQGPSFTLVGLAICRTDQEWRVVVNGMAETVRRLPTLERGLATGIVATTPGDWLPLIRADLAPSQDPADPSGSYREQVLARLLLSRSVRPPQ